MRIQRRSFMALGGSLAVSRCLPAASANDRINVGVVGLGSRGYNLLDGFLGHDDCRVVAVCDVDEFHHRDRSWGTGPKYGRMPGAKRVEQFYAKSLGRASYRGVEAYGDFRQLADRKDVDVVVVATPDHWHALCTLHALKSGKDVYCEKPVTHLFQEGQWVYREVARQRAVFQVGSQQRSDDLFRRAVELVRNGLLGKVSRFEVGLPLGYGKPMGDDSVIKIPKQLNYDFWCGPANVLPYMRARHHRWWRGHTAYGGGVLMDWIGHHNDIGHWAIGMDASGPTSVQAVDWTFPETDVYDTPQDYSIQCEYAGGVTSSISTRNRGGLKLVGDSGWVWVNRGKIEASEPAWLTPDFVPGKFRLAQRPSDHVRDFLDCVRSRSECVAPAEVGHRSITPGHLGYVSQKLGRKLNWNPETETVVGDSEAQKLLTSVNYREPWQENG